MTDLIIKKRNIPNIFKGSFYVLSVLLVYSSAIYFFSFITADPDLWGHIYFGKEIWASKAIPRFDIYSYTAFGDVWINHEWFSEVLMALLFQIFGSAGLLIGKTIIGIIVVVVISFISYYRKRQYIIYSVVFVTAVFIMSPGFMTRPQLVTFLFISFFLLVIHLYIERGVHILWTLPLIMILWVNSHGGFIIGAGLLPIIAILEYISCNIKKRDKGHLHSLILWVLITEVSMLINPYGADLLEFLTKTLSQPRSISEWDAVSLFDLSYARLKIFSICVILSFFIKRHKNRYWEIGIIIVSMVFAFIHQRHTPLFAIISAPFLVEKLSDLAEGIRIDDRLISICSYVVLNIVVTFIIGYQLSGTINKYRKTEFNIIVDPNVYPVRAVRFLKQNNIKGNLLVPFDWGEYAIWKLFPENKVSIDGRFRTVYPEDVINDHFNGEKNEKDWKLLLDRYQTDIVLTRRNPFSQRMITLPTNDWIYVYSDNLSIIFLKNKDSMKKLIGRFISNEIIYPKGELSVYFP